MVCSTRSYNDGILDYAVGLGDALARLHGLSIELVVRRASGWKTRELGGGDSSERGASSLVSAVSDADAVLLHYNPFSWGRWGFAPRLAPSLAGLRLRRPELVLGVVFHERYVDLGGVRGTAMGAWQRVQFHAVLRTATAAFASTDAWTAALRHQTRVPAAKIPICSNLPDVRGRREFARTRLELDPSTFCVATFGIRHVTRLDGHVEHAVSAIASSGMPVALLNLGAHPPAFPEIERSVRVISPGRLDAPAVAECLTAADLYLAPFVDGVSSRRTTLMAALQHGIAVVGTDGTMTGPAMRSARDAFMLTPAADAVAFGEAALHLALDQRRRERQGAAGRRFYEQHHDWPVACDVALEVLNAGRAL
ncbi:MAG: hypothetical protein QOH12_3358 [Solirubrobacteraceae bacterium]|nr:hypothetical protein [Solirubrobacteraceae bacterium]